MTLCIFQTITHYQLNRSRTFFDEWPYKKNFNVTQLFVFYLYKLGMVFPIKEKHKRLNPCLTVGPWADVKNGFTWKIIIVLKVRDGHGE